MNISYKLELENEHIEAARCTVKYIKHITAICTV